jgi:formylglycine-generating enzyme required for sulfatase activity
MVYVPPGPFWMGGDKEGEPLADENGTRRHQVTLPGYWIGKTPVNGSAVSPSCGKDATMANPL